MKKNINLLEGSINGLIIKLALPVMAADLLRASYNFVDMIFASRLGGIQVASIAFVGPIFRLLSAIGVGLAAGGISIIAKFLGEENREEAEKNSEQLRLITFITAMIIALTGFLTTELFLPLFDLDENLLNEAIIYTRIRFLSIPALLLYQLYLVFYKAQGKMNIVFRMSLIGLIGNVLFNSLFIFVLDMGVNGLAYGTLVTQVLQALLVIIFYHLEKHDFHLSPNILKAKLEWDTVKKIVKVCFPLVISQGSTDFGFMLINTIIVQYGYEVIAAFAIGNQINSMFFGPSTALAQANIPIIAQNWGAGIKERIQKVMKHGFLYSLSFGVLTALLLQIVLIVPLAKFFAKGDVKIYQNIVNYLRICSWSIIGWSIYQFFIGVFTAFQRTKVSMMINMVRLWIIRIPMLLLFKYVFIVGAYGVWWTMFVSNMMTAIFATIFYFTFVPGIIKKMSHR